MAIRPFLAMTAEEIAESSRLPAHTAWMACHFSPYGPGLSNLPRTLPPGSLLMVDDITPIRGHAPQRIADQLRLCADRLQSAGILLDFQRPAVEETAALVRYLTAALPHPVAVSHFYADVCSCAVCLPPAAPSEAPEGYFSKWPDRELWLELSLTGERITVTKDGATSELLRNPDARDTDFFDKELLCHYRQEIREDAAIFTLFRNRDDLQQLLHKAEAHGITAAVGLYQEFRYL